MDHNNRTTQFTDPRLNAQILFSILRRQTSGTTSTTTTTTTVTAAAAAAAATPTPSTSTATTVTGVTTALPTVNGAAASIPVSSPRLRVNETDLPQGLLNESELLPKYRRDLVGKLRALRAELTTMQPQSGHCRLEVSRIEVFEESYRSVI